MAFTITRETIIDDSGLGLDGTEFDSDFWTNVYDAIDAVFAEIAAGGPFDGIRLYAAASTVTGTQHNYNIDALAGVGHGGLGRLQWNGASAVTFTGFAGGTTDRVLLVTNITAAMTLTLVHQSGSSDAAKQFTTPSGADVVVPPGGQALLVYTGTKWFATGVSGVGQVSSGAQVTSRVLDTNYQAATDVFVSFTDTGGSGRPTFEFRVEGATPPTVVHGVVGGSDGNDAAGSFFVRKGDYWKIALTGGTPGTQKIIETPLGH